MAIAAAAPTVNKPSGQLDEVSGDWPMLRALISGTGAMRKAGKAFLPQFPQEEENSYKTRLSVATLYPAFRHTAQVMAAKPFSRQMQCKVAKEIERYFQDIDMQGTPLTAFCMGLFFECLSAGLKGVLVEYPVAGDVKTVADEKRAGVRPYLTTYPAESILGWRVGKSGLEQLRLLENAEEPDGEWGVKKVVQVRVLKPGSWETWRANPDKPDEWALHKDGKTTLKEIPFVFFYGERISYGVGRCPLLDLAFENVEHWQSSSDQQTILHVSRVPVLFAKGFGDKDEIVIGASHAVMTSRTDADLKYVEHTGAAVEAGRQAIIDLQDRMHATGATLISKKPAPVTATQIGSEDESGKSLLQSIAETFEESLEICLSLMARYINVDDKAEVTLYKDFSIMSDTDSATLNDAAGTGVISKQTAFEELKRRDVISPDREWEEELARLSLDQKNAPKDPKQK